MAEGREKVGVYHGKSGNGFSQAKLERILAELNGLNEENHPTTHLTKKIRDEYYRN